MARDEISKIQGKYGIIGRRAELAKALIAIKSRKHLLIEGNVGVGKTVLAEAISQHLNQKMYRIDGDERYSEQKLVGWFDPPLVMAKGYSKETFIPGPLIEAMSNGGFLFINELNRMPEGTQNVLLPAMDEGRATVPKIGHIEAKDGFTVIATQNPEEYIGTSRLSEALKDRFVWIKLDYQSEDEELEIVKKKARSKDPLLIQIAVDITRRTREDPLLRRGASVRGAIDIVAIASNSLGRKINESTEATQTLQDAALMALTSKVEAREASGEKLEAILRQIVDEILAKDLHGSQAQPNETKKEHSPNF